MRWCDDDIQVTDFSIAGGSDALNPCPPWQCCTETHYTHFHGKNNCWHDSNLAVFASVVSWHGTHRACTFLQARPAISHWHGQNQCSAFLLWLSEKFFDFLNKFIDFLPVHIMSCSDRPSRTWLVIQVHISTTIPRFSRPLTRTTYVHNIFPIKSQYLLLHFDGNFIFVGQKLSKSLLFNVLQCSWKLVIRLEQNTAHTTTFPKPYHMLNWRPRNSIEVGTNKALRSHSLC